MHSPTKIAAILLAMAGAFAPALAEEAVGTFETSTYASQTRAGADADAAAALALSDVESLRTQLPVTIPTDPPDGGPHALDALIYSPAHASEGHRHPAIVITHGNPRDTSTQRSTRLHRYGHLAEEFARRG